MEALTHGLGIEWKSLIAQLINFGILAFALWKLLYKPVIASIDARDKRMSEEENKTKSIEDRLSQIEADRTEIIKKAKAESDSILKEARDLANSLKESIAKEAQIETEKRLLKCEKDLSEQAEKIQREIKSEIGTIVIDALEKVIGGYVTDDVKTKMKQDIVSEISKK